MAKQQAKRYRPMAQGAAGHASCCLPQPGAAREAAHEGHGEDHDDLARDDLKPQGPRDARGEPQQRNASSVPQPGRLADGEKPGGKLAMPHDAEPQGVR